MKSEIVNQVEKEVAIDWGKPQILTYKNTDSGAETIVFSNGSHKNDSFEATILYSNNHESPYFRKSWAKDSFKPLQGSVTIEFSND